MPLDVVAGRDRRVLTFEVTASTLSHYLEKLKNEDLVRVQREGTFLRRLFSRRSAAGTLRRSRS